MTKRDQLIQEIEAFCAAKRISERRLSLLATGNVKFAGRLRKGTVTARSMDKVDNFMLTHARTRPDAFAALVVPVSGDAEMAAA